MNRSARPFVRNPLLALPGMKKLQARPRAEREALRSLLVDLAADANDRADRCWRRHKPPTGKTSLNRMQRTAFLEAERIEISQDARVRDGELKEPMPEQVERRDDFAGIVRLIDKIMSDVELLERFKA
jgi:hypothetical protein